MDIPTGGMLKLPTSTGERQHLEALILNGEERGKVRLTQWFSALAACWNYLQS